MQSAVAGRPVVNFSLGLNYAIGGLAPTGYHAWNLAVHLLCGLLLFGIVRRTLKRLETPAAALPVRAGGHLRAVVSRPILKADRRPPSGWPLPAPCSGSCTRCRPK